MDFMSNRQVGVTVNTGYELQRYRQQTVAQQVIYHFLAKNKLPTRRIETFNRNQVIFYPGQSTDRLFFIQKGAVKLSSVFDSGHENALALLPKNSIFGSLPFLQALNSTQYCQAVALASSTVLSASIEQVEHALTRNTELASALLQVLGHRTITGHRLIEILSSNRTGMKLARFLLLLCQHFGVSRDGDVMIDLFLTHYEIANFIGVTRVTITKELGKLRASEAISIDCGKVVVHNLEQLRIRACFNDG